MIRHEEKTHHINCWINFTRYRLNIRVCSI